MRYYLEPNTRQICLIKQQNKHEKAAVVDTSNIFKRRRFSWLKIRIYGIKRNQNRWMDQKIKFLKYLSQLARCNIKKS